MYRMHAVSNHPSTRVARNSLCTLTIALLMLEAATLPPSAHAAESTLPRFVTQASTQINCDGTPFGKRVALWQETELALLTVSDNDLRDEIDTYQFPHDSKALSVWFDIDMDLQGMNGSTTVDMVNIDLDGDGRDELVTAGRWYADDSLRLAVLGHDPDANTYPQATVIDTWESTQTFDSLELAAGDFDGSGDGQQELAIFMNTDTGLRVLILTGDGYGGLAQAADEYAGKWEWLDASWATMTSGDLLLDGREQILVTSIVSGADERLEYHLLEFETVNPAILGTGWPGSVNVGSMHSYQSLDDEGFRTDDPEQTHPADQITALETHVADLTDSASEEIVTLLQFVNGNTSYLGMQLQHYVTTRDVDNHITSIDFAKHPRTGGNFDSGFIVDESNNGPASFEAALANVDLLPGAEVIVARAEPLNGGTLDVLTYKAGIRLVPGFTWQANGLDVTFQNTSVGDNVEVVSWTFGDESNPVSVDNPFHTYDSAGDHTVTLTVRANGGEPVALPITFHVESGTTDDGGDTPSYIYKMSDTPSIQGHSVVDMSTTPTMVNVVSADMNSDGPAEIVTAAKTGSEMITRTVWKRAEATSYLTPEAQYGYGFSDLSTLELAAVDLDGDTIRAEVSNDCRVVQEPQVRQLVWLPPYFSHLQADAEKEATYGESIEGGSEYEQRAGSFTSSDISGFVGGTLGDAAYGIEVAARATVGHRYQSNHGEIHGNGNSLEVYQGYSQSDGEALLVYQEYSFQCYSYNVTTAIAGSVPESGLRMCNVSDDPTIRHGDSAVRWDTDIPAGSTGHPPAQWVPLHRDWNSIAMFQPVSSNANISANMANNATDGDFDSVAHSASGLSQPYLQIDLGSVRDISNIRIFPPADANPDEGGSPAAQLAGYRVYTSSSPMLGNALPSGPGVRVFEPMTADDSVYDRWNIWTRDPDNPQRMLKARFVRLQHPGIAALQIAEIQVFGDLHADPPRYPDAVCDKTLGDGIFSARVWDEVHGTFRNIDVRGDLLWDGTGGPVNMACTNDGDLNTAVIWNNFAVGGDITTHWNLNDSQWSSLGESNSFESANYVGAEFSLTGGFIAAVTTGVAAEFSTGITSEVQTSTHWSDSLQLGGAIGGFANEFSELVEKCEYNPRPYAFHLMERSITGYQHDIYVVDYVVRQDSGSTAWQRGSVPILCSRPDPIFASGFE